MVIRKVKYIAINVVNMREKCIFANESRQPYGYVTMSFGMERFINILCKMKKLQKLKQV